MKTERTEAQICFRSWCVKFYGENAKLINGLATIAGVVILLSTIVKSLKD